MFVNNGEWNFFDTLTKTSLSNKKITLINVTQVKNIIVRLDEVLKYRWKVSLLHFYSSMMEEDIYRNMLEVTHMEEINLLLKFF